jgi:hypothetical protein
MPNGGVPINLELWMGDINLPGTVVLLQHSRTLKLQRVSDTGPQSVELIGAIEITRPFLSTVVAHILDPVHSRSMNSVSNDYVSAMFVSGYLHLLKSDGSEVAVLSGELLSVVAAFMAYWVDHDGLQVPTGLPIRYLSRIMDAEGRDWNLNWAF